jgi:Tol biopolymer transport system component
LFDALAGRWSPDGGRIAFFSEGHVCVYDILLMTTTRLTSEPQNVTGVPAWSPDGAQIAYVYFSTADHSLSVLDPAAEQQRPRVLWEGHGISRSPNWSPSKNILVFATPNQLKDVYAIDPAGAVPPQRPFADKLNFAVKDPAWSSDGKGLVFVKPN